MRLIGIQIFDNTLPEIRKSLYCGWYPFLKCKHAPNMDGSDLPEVDEDAVCPSDFFRIDERLPEVNVSVVVGKNGTGKSSLLDYSKVNAIMDEARKKSYEYLKNAIGS